MENFVVFVGAMALVGSAIAALIFGINLILTIYSNKEEIGTLNTRITNEYKYFSDMQSNIRNRINALEDKVNEMSTVLGTQNSEPKMNDLG